MNWQAINVFGLLFQIGAGIWVIKFGRNTDKAADEAKTYKRLRKIGAKMQMGMGLVWIVDAIIDIVVALLSQK